MPRHVGGAMGVRSPSRNVELERPLRDASTDTHLRDLERATELAEELEGIVARMPPGSFTQDPGMRAQGGEFTDVASPGYARQAAAHAGRGGVKEYATSVEEQQTEAKADTLRNRVGMVLATMMGMGVASAAGGVSATLRNAGMASSTRNVLGGLTNRAGAGAPYRSALHQGMGPGYRPAVPGQSPLHMSPGVRPMPRQPAIRDAGPPPGMSSGYRMPGSQSGLPPRSSFQPGMPPQSSFRGTTVVDPVSPAVLLELLRRRG
jgi:hypothetical protein